MKSVTKGLLAIIACALLWSTSGLFIKLLEWHPMVIAGGRSLIAAVFMLIVGRRQPWQSAETRPKSTPVALWGGACCYSITMILFVIANKLTASANVILLQYSAPIFAALLGWALAKERPRSEHWAALVVILLGLWLFFKDGLAGGGFGGDIIALLSGVTFGAYSVFMRLQKNGRPEDSMLISHIITAALGLPFAFLAPPSLSWAAVGAIGALGLFQIGLASLLFAYAIRRISAVQAMLTAVVEPVLNPVWVLIFTGERPSPAAIAGGGLILLAVTASSLIGIRRQPQ